MGYLGNYYRLTWPTDIMLVGKHKGKTIEKVISEDKPYFNWMLTSNFEISELLKDLAKGENIVNIELTHSFTNGVLYIKKHEYWLRKAVKFVNKAKKRRISSNLLTQYKCELPYTEKTETIVEYHDCTKFHQDYTTTERVVTNRIYNNDDLKNWINSKLKLHNL